MNLCFSHSARHAGRRQRPLRHRGCALVVFVCAALISLYKQSTTFTDTIRPVATDTIVESLSIPPISPILTNRTTVLSIDSSSTVSKIPSTINASNVVQNENNSYWGARYPNGSLGYIADPTTLRREREHFLRRYKNETVSSVGGDAEYWAALEGFENRYRQGTYMVNASLAPEFVCKDDPGRGYEEEGGFKLLTEKIQVADNNETSQPVRILCVIYTHDKMRDLARASALSWGYKCDGFLAFSTETIPALGMVDLVHPGEESYGNMWQKTRSIWAYIYQHFRHQYDYFHLGGDDMYVIVENMRRFLVTFESQTGRGDPVYLGQWIRQKHGYYVSGGPGYTLNRVSLERFVEQALPDCNLYTKASYEDRLFSSCMKQIGIYGGDTRDVATGEQQYHDCSPHCVYTSRAKSGRRANFHSRAVAYWETLPHPDVVRHYNETVGVQNDLDAAAVYSVSLHNLHHPQYMGRIHAILFPRTCPSESQLGRGLW
jgi:hypothetical protein